MQQDAETSNAADGPGTGAPIDALKQQALRYRFWHAKAKRELGWWEPTSEQVLARA
jgi:hypothetical protein